MAIRLELDFERFRRNHARVLEELAQIAPGDTPRIVTVTKYLEVAAARQLYSAGFNPLGENRAPELLEKTDGGPERPSWHFIGNLQRNKIGRVAPRVAMIHAVDSERLAAAIHHWLEAQSDERALNPDLLVQVNTSGEESKSGLSASEALRAVPQWCIRYPQLRFAGLMTMAPLAPPEECRPHFSALRELRDEIGSELPEELRDRFRELSMGMSNDYRIAAEEGATLIRLGRLLYL